MKELFKPLPTVELSRLLADALFNADDPPPDEVVVFRIDFQNIGSLGNFALLTGLPKAGKGKYLSGFTAAALTRAAVFNLDVKLPHDKQGVSYWDTEQSKYDHHTMMKTVKQLMDTDTFPGNFRAYHCRKHDAQTIIAMIEHELQHNPTMGVLILDGLLDLIDSFNDEKQSKSLVNFLKRVTDVHNIFVLAVLHRSKSVDKSMGHLGSAADRAAQSVLVVEKNRELKHYVLRGEYLRNADDFKPISIYYNKQLNMWEQTETIEDGAQAAPSKLFKPKPGDLDISLHSLNVGRIFNAQPVQLYDVLIQNIKEVYGVGRNWAVDCVKHLTQQTDLIHKTETGYTNRKQARLYVQQ